MNSMHLPYWLAAIHLQSVPPHKIFHWLHYFPSIKALFTATEDELRALHISDACIAELQAPNWSAVEKSLTWAQQTQQHLITIEDESYPPQLKEIAAPPLLLYVAGEVAALKQAQIAMVGSRHASAYGLKNADHFSYSLAQAGIAITSGLARGIDAASHRGALKAHGTTLSVCGTGLKYIYPRAHHALAQQIKASGGAIISEFPLDTQPHAFNFPRRNRIIGGLSLGVLVVEAALKSGSLITARHALEQGREVFAIPGPITHPLAQGCHYLIRQGAKLAETVGDILEEIDPTLYNNVGGSLPAPESRSEQLDLSIRQLLDQIQYEITPMDVILLRSGLTASELSSMLLTLELNGYIQSVPGGYTRSILNR